MEVLIYPIEFVCSAPYYSTGDSCGVDGDWKSKLIPDWYPFSKGLSLRWPCKIHDFMYTKGKTDSDKILADIVFFSNLLIVLNKLRASDLAPVIHRFMSEMDGAYTTYATNNAWIKFMDSVKNLNKESKSWYFRKWFRFAFAEKYFIAVEKYGHDAYWSGKRDSKGFNEISEYVTDLDGVKSRLYASMIKYNNIQ